MGTHDTLLRTDGQYARMMEEIGAHDEIEDEQPKEQGEEAGVEEDSSESGEDEDTDLAKLVQDEERETVWNYSLNN